MKSDWNIKDDVYDIVIKSELAKEVTGVVKTTKRPHNSTSEDIVISVLANQMAQRQEAYVNVNVYVKDDNVDGQYEESHERVEKLCQLCLDLFDNVRGNDFRLSIRTGDGDNGGGSQGQRVIEIDTGEHVINNKLLYQVIND